MIRAEGEPRRLVCVPDFEREFFGARVLKCSRMGIPKASVLPEPVEALPMTSCPARISGIDEDWIGVGVEKPSFDIAARTSEWRPRPSHAETMYELVTTEVIRRRWEVYHQLRTPMLRLPDQQMGLLDFRRVNQQVLASCSSLYPSSQFSSASPW